MSALFKEAYGDTIVDLIPHEMSSCYDVKLTNGSIETVTDQELYEQSKKYWG